MGAKDNTISIAKALCNALQNWTEWPKDEAFDSPATPSSSETPAMPSSEASAMPPSAPSIEATPESSIQQFLDRPQQSTPTAESTDQTSYKVENGPEVISYESADPVASEAFHASDAIDTHVAPMQQHQSIESSGLQQQPQNHEVLTPWEKDQAAYERQIFSWKAQATYDRNRSMQQQSPESSTKQLVESSVQQVAESSRKQSPESSR